MRKNGGAKTPLEMDFSINSSNVILDGGTGSEGGLGLKMGL